MEHLGLSASLGDYEAQADSLLRGHHAGDERAMRFINENHPRYKDPKIRWKPVPTPSDDIRSAPFDHDDARLGIARWYSFRDWEALAELVSAVQNRTPGIYEFEAASEAVIDGDLDRLQALLREHPDLVKTRSTRITPHDPERHRATLLHYIAANGVEGYRQRTPPNAVEIARALLDAGSDPNALAYMYGGECTTMSMLVSSSRPAQAGLQVALAEVLLDYGADPNERGAGNWTSPLMTALVFGYADSAELLARRGARVDRLADAAGLGRFDRARALLPGADAFERQAALALAAQLGRVEIVRLFLDAGEDPNRLNPAGMHAHSTPLHQAAVAGHEAVVRLFVERGARLDIRDAIWNATPRGWAEHGGHETIAAFLRDHEPRQ